VKILNAIIFLILTVYRVSAQSPAYDIMMTYRSTSPAPGPGIGNVSKLAGDEMMDTDFNSEMTAGGFQRFKNINVISIPETDSDLEENYFIYPHPVLNNLVLNFEKMKAGNYILEVYDISAKLLIHTKLKLKKRSFFVRISFVECANGVYLVKIRNATNSIEKAFRIIK
jgi:hypothetical protein